MQSDASMKGYAVLWDNNWTAGFFNSEKEPEEVWQCEKNHCHWINVSVPEPHNNNINVLETIPVLLAVNKYAQLWENEVVLWYSDNSQVVNSKTPKPWNTNCGPLL